MKTNSVFSEKKTHEILMTNPHYENNSEETVVHVGAWTIGTNYLYNNTGLYASWSLPSGVLRS